MEQKPTPHDGQYFIMGNNKIIISEHFRQDGKPLISILEKVILDAGKMPESRINTAFFVAKMKYLLKVYGKIELSRN